MAAARINDPFLPLPTNGVDFSAATGKAIIFTGGFAAVAGALAPRIIGVAVDDPGTSQSTLTVQHRDQARGLAGGAITVGQELATDASGRFVAAASTNPVVGIALSAASGAGSMFNALINFLGAK
jgi:glycine cleavage system pyridoxal-binding protein P